MTIFIEMWNVSDAIIQSRSISKPLLLCINHDLRSLITRSCGSSLRALSEYLILHLLYISLHIHEPTGELILCRLWLLINLLHLFLLNISTNRPRVVNLHCRRVRPAYSPFLFVALCDFFEVLYI